MVIRSLALGLCWLLVVACWSRAADVLPPAAERFLAGKVADSPDFQRHVMPLLGRLGCNGRSCHGSFQGRGGFRLSLFGYDPAFDHEALTRLTGDADQPRIDRDNPAASLMLVKPTDADLHEGGKRMEADGWESRLLAEWIRSGAPAIETPHKLQRLEVIPAEIVFSQPGESATIRVIAHWADGTAEDVTCLCRFQTNNEALADITLEALVTCKGRGDTHVVAFYDNGVTAVPVMAPVTGQVGGKYPQVAAETTIDRLVLDKLSKLGVVPSEVCTDAEFLRRASLDITGTLPTAAEVEAFLADASADKRSRKIDELLERPAYAAWWATKLCDLTGNNPQWMAETAFRSEQSAQWYDWIYARLRENVPYDELVARIVLSVGRQEGQSYADYAHEMTAYVRRDKPADFADRATMPHYWSRRTFTSAEDRALGVAYAFLGMRLQCAQCHKHPFDQWSQDDFQKFAAFFSGITYGVSGEARDDYNRMQDELGLRGKNGNEMRRMMSDLARKGTSVPFRELYVTAARRGGARTARLLAGEEVDLSAAGDPRAPVMEWMRRKDNPYFARAFVNRAWAHYFHAGIVNPPDDMNLANPPSNAALLEYLADGFIKHGYDMKWLHREITNSAAYQRSWRPNETNLHDLRNFSRAIPRRLPAEVAYDAIVCATASSTRLAALEKEPASRAISHASIASRTSPAGYAMQVFGKPARETTCDCERSGEPTLLQSVYLQNDRDVTTLIDRGGWVAEAARQGRPPEELVRQAYLRTLSRPPNQPELQRSLAYLSESSSAEGLRDLVWALINTKEFVVNH